MVEEQVLELELFQLAVARMLLQEVQDTVAFSVQFPVQCLVTGKELVLYPVYQIVIQVMKQ